LPDPTCNQERERQLFIKKIVLGMALSPLPRTSLARRHEPVLERRVWPRSKQ